VHEKQTVRYTCYEEVVKRLIAQVHSIRPEFQESGSWYALHNNAWTYSSGDVSEFLEQGTSMLSHPPYSRDLVPAGLAGWDYTV
jgi:hypothetical protein